MKNSILEICFSNLLLILTKDWSQYLVNILPKEAKKDSMLQMYFQYWQQIFKNWPDSSLNWENTVMNNFTDNLDFYERFLKQRIV